MAARSRELHADPCPLYKGREWCPRRQEELPQDSPNPAGPQLGLSWAWTGRSWRGAAAARLWTVPTGRARGFQLSAGTEPARPCRPQGVCVSTEAGICLCICISTNASWSPSRSELRVQMETHQEPGLNFPGCYPSLPKAHWDWATIPIRYLLNL